MTTLTFIKVCIIPEILPWRYEIHWHEATALVDLRPWQGV